MRLQPRSKYYPKQQYYRGEHSKIVHILGRTPVTAKAKTLPKTRQLYTLYSSKFHKSSLCGELGREGAGCCKGNITRNTPTNTYKFFPSWVLASNDAQIFTQNTPTTQLKMSSIVPLFRGRGGQGAGKIFNSRGVLATNDAKILPKQPHYTG